MFCILRYILGYPVLLDKKLTYPSLGRRFEEPFESDLIDLPPVSPPLRLRKVGRVDLAAADVSDSLTSVSGTGSSVKDLLMESWANFLDLEQGYKSVLSR